MSAPRKSEGKDVWTQYGHAEGSSVAQKLAELFEVLGLKWDLEEECVCALSFTSLQATPHPTEGQPAQKTHKNSHLGPSDS